MKRRRKRGAPGGLGGTKTEHVGAGEYYLTKVEPALDEARTALSGSVSCSRAFAHLSTASVAASAAATEASWVGKATRRDDHFHGRVSRAAIDVTAMERKFMKVCVR